ncbi:hypothetical protein PHAVU_004G019400 [Phaseolus vulgaris]|uniref:BAH domain-containing protein n=1 Tax=Phaseolus vulgaris TaxID=3885 RepID=V7C170_PHAVU|nr:hypothetical protein PHAVU_004G019400g [Phaseolus vulgaris]ESW23113.1 hypothetical protein PHAVU_004G019400g [Phaseolus vulgaris]
MHGCAGDQWKHNRHMWPVPANATTVAIDSSPSQFICKDGRKIRAGDCALFKPPRDSPPFIGIIRKLSYDKQESPSLEVHWLYRPADLKLAKGIVLEAAPNEVFYSFHKDETPAASLLHPCKVAFLRKGVELPSGISAFVCRRVYDIENNCLWWLTDKDYLNEEVNQLLDKTKLEMHGAVQSGGRSPKPLNGPASTQSLKSGSDNIQNSSSFGAQGKGKKRERDQGSDSSKKERLFKIEDGDSGQFRPESMLKSEIAKITDKGGLVDFEGVEKLVQLMQPDSADKKIDLPGRIMLVDVIALTDRYDCLGWFVQLRGLPVLDEWLQEVHKGKIGDGNMPKESDKSVDEFLLALLRALDKLPVNLHALQTCNVGKSVNHLRTHKNAEIQRKARSLVDTWKRRVEAEMNMNDSKSGSNRAVSWPAKPANSESPHVGNRKTGGSSDNVVKSPAIQPSLSKSSQSKLSSGEALSKSSSPGSTKSLTTSVGMNSKDQNSKVFVGAATADLPLTPIKEERSSSSSQSQNNSITCSSEHAKTIGSCREDAKSSTAVSMSASKIHGCASRTRKSSNGIHGPGAVGQKEHNSAKISTRNSPTEKVSPTRASHEKSVDQPLADQGNNQRLILRLPNTGRSPSRGASGGSFEEPATTSSKALSPADLNDNQDRRLKTKTECLLTHVSNMINESCDANEALIGDENKGTPIVDERCRAIEDSDKVLETSKPTSLPSGFVSRSGQTYDASLSPMNALVESCVKFSEASSSVSHGDDGMNLLATVAAGEISRSENASPVASPERKSSPAGDEQCSGNDLKLKHSGEAAVRTLSELNGRATGEHPLNTVDSSQIKNELRHPAMTVSRDFPGDGETISSSHDTRINVSSTDLLQNVEGPCLRPETIEDASVTILTPKKESNADAGVSDSKLKPRASSFDDDQKVDHMKEEIIENEKMLVSKPFTNVESENESGEKKPDLTSSVDNENHISVEKATGTGILVQKTSPTAENSESIYLKKELPASGNALMVPMDENADDMKSVVIEPDERRREQDSSSPDDSNDCAEDNMGRKEAIGQCSGSSSVQPDLQTMSRKENEVSKSCEQKLDANPSEVSGERHAYSASGADATVKLDFDLNEGFPFDDASQGEIARQEDPITSSAVHVPCPLPFPISSISGGFHPSITVASAAKGPVIPPENPLRMKGELGWKGSAATSAFRPAEPRKNAEMQSSTNDITSVEVTSIKQSRAPLDFDLNVADERCFEDVGSHGSLESGPHDRSVGLDLDLNRVDDTPEIGSFSISKLDIPSLPSKPSLSSGLSNGGSVSRDFDLNNGLGLEEVGSEVPARSQLMKNSVPFPSAVHSTRTNNAEYGNYSAWFPPGNSYPAITVPPLLPGRGEQSYVSGAGAQRIMGPTGSSPFGPEIYRGSVLSSSPAVAYPSTTAFPYPGFPFETNFPLSSNSFSGSTAFMDSSNVGGLCFPTMTSQPVGPGGVVSSTYPRPYVMSLPGGTSNVIPDSRKWGSQSLDLNSGPGVADTERRDDRLSSGLRQMSVPNTQASIEDHLKMLQMAGAALKRKEPDGGWDAERFGYKQHSRQ